MAYVTISLGVERDEALKVMTTIHGRICISKSDERRKPDEAQQQWQRRSIFVWSQKTTCRRREMQTETALLGVHPDHYSFTFRDTLPAF